MSLEIQIKTILNDFDSTHSNDFLRVLAEIMHEFKSNLTIEYLTSKIQKIKDLTDEAEKKKQCKLLFPYLDWYLQGL